jgi:hypothetical protein
VADLLKEQDIKALVLSHFPKMGMGSRTSIIASEFFIDRRLRRVDIAALSNDFVGIEVKSEVDTLVRLQAQLSAYENYFDRVVVVTAEKHSKGVLNQAADHIGIYVVDGHKKINEVRAAKRIEEFDIRRRLSLLTMAELRRSLGLKSNCQFSRRQLLDLASEMDNEAARIVIYAVFQERFSATSRAFWESLTGRHVEPEKLIKLSRYAERRQWVAEQERKREEFWKNWCVDADRLFGKNPIEA